MATVIRPAARTSLRRRIIVSERLPDREEEGERAERAAFALRRVRAEAAIIRILHDAIHRLPRVVLLRHVTRHDPVAGTDTQQRLRLAIRARQVVEVCRTGTRCVVVVAEVEADHANRRINARADAGSEAQRAVAQTGIIRAAAPDLAKVGEQRPLQQCRQNRTAQPQLQVSNCDGVAADRYDAKWLHRWIQFV